MSNKYFAKGKELIGEIRDWQDKTGGSFWEYKKLVEREGLPYYTRDGENLRELHEAFQFLVTNRY